jgi:hypothetical protein
MDSSPWARAVGGRVVRHESSGRLGAPPAGQGEWGSVLQVRNRLPSTRDNACLPSVRCRDARRRVVR